MKRAALIFCLLMLAIGSCTPSAPEAPVETATMSVSPTASSTNAPTQTATSTNTSTPTTTQPPPSETQTATLIPVFVVPSATTKPKRKKSPDDEPPPVPTDTATETLTATPEITDTPTPTLILTCDHETAFAFLSVSTENLKVGDTVTVTVTLKNEGCVNLGLPQYRLRIQPDGPDPIFSPENPEPVVHYLSVRPGESDSQEFVLTAVASGGATLSGSASFEVHLGYPGPAYWGYAGTAPLSLTVVP